VGMSYEIDTRDRKRRAPRVDCDRDLIRGGDIYIY